MKGYQRLHFVQLTEQHRSVGRAHHHLTSGEMQRPHSLVIAHFAGGEGYYLLYLDDRGEELTDTLHDSTADAMKQAEWEFGVQSREWQNTH